MMQENYSEDGRVTKLQLHIGSLIDFNRLGQLRIANTTTMPILERDLTSLKRKMDVTLQIWCKSRGGGVTSYISEYGDVRAL